MRGELHDDDSEVGSSEIEGQELSLLLSVGQAPDVGRETLDAGGLVLLLGQPFLEIRSPKLISLYRNLGP